jgi:hypothetical protein
VIVDSSRHESMSIDSGETNSDGCDPQWFILNTD